VKTTIDDASSELVRISSDTEEEAYSLATAAIDAALKQDCEFSYIYACIVKTQIEHCWFSRAISTTS
jgi:hypothetical protein